VIIVAIRRRCAVMFAPSVETIANFAPSWVRPCRT
jgi:hypothetical protein